PIRSFVQYGVMSRYGALMPSRIDWSFVYSVSFMAPNWAVWSVLWNSGARKVIPRSSFAICLSSGWPTSPSCVYCWSRMYDAAAGFALEKMSPSVAQVAKAWNIALSLLKSFWVVKARMPPAFTNGFLPLIVTKDSGTLSPSTAPTPTSLNHSPDTLPELSACADPAPVPVAIVLIEVGDMPFCFKTAWRVALLLSDCVAMPTLLPASCCSDVIPLPAFTAMPYLKGYASS